MQFTVTIDHLRHGVANDCFRCPVALCIQEATGDSGWEVAGDAICNTARGIYLNAPPEVDEFARDFDYGYITYRSITSNNSNQIHDVLAHPETYEGFTFELDLEVRA